MQSLHVENFGAVGFGSPSSPCKSGVPFNSVTVTLDPAIVRAWIEGLTGTEVGGNLTKAEVDIDGYVVVTFAEAEGPDNGR